MKIKLSKSQWEGIGKKAGWNKMSQTQPPVAQPSPTAQTVPAQAAPASFGSVPSVKVTPAQIQKIKDYAEKMGFQVKNTPDGFEVVIPV